VVFPNVLPNGVPKVPKGCSEGFCHFWHLITLGFSRNTRTTYKRSLGSIMSTDECKDLKGPFRMPPGSELGGENVPDYALLVYNIGHPTRE
jgi:hypothetical protein